MQTHVIYMIGAYGEGGSKPDAIKIGIAADVHERLYYLQTGNHLTLRVMAIWRVSSFRKARHIENCAHKRFGKSRLNREWFKPHVMAFMDYLNTICAEQMTDERKDQIKKAASDAEEESIARSLDSELILSSCIFRG